VGISTTLIIMARYDFSRPEFTDRESPDRESESGDIDSESTDRESESGDIDSESTDREQEQSSILSKRELKKKLIQKEDKFDLGSTTDDRYESNVEDEDEIELNDSSDSIIQNKPEPLEPSHKGNVLKTQGEKFLYAPAPKNRPGAPSKFMTIHLDKDGKEKIEVPSGIYHEQEWVVTNLSLRIKKQDWDLIQKAVAASRMTHREFFRNAIVFEAKRYFLREKHLKQAIIEELKEELRGEIEQDIKTKQEIEAPRHQGMKELHEIIEKRLELILRMQKIEAEFIKKKLKKKLKRVHDSPLDSSMDEDDNLDSNEDTDADTNADTYADTNTEAGSEDSDSVDSTGPPKDDILDIIKNEAASAGMDLQESISQDDSSSGLAPTREDLYK
jgi:uncharacterized protein (DUF1778 family)